VSRQPNPRRIKMHRSYSVEELAAGLAVHKNTVRNWVRAGLPVVSGRGPTLFLGEEAQAFLLARRVAAKRPCPPGHFFCLKCREPRPPAEGMVEYRPKTAVSGDLTAFCTECQRIMHRKIRDADVAAFFAAVRKICAPTLAPSPRLSKCPQRPLDCDSLPKDDDHEKASPR
jgi:hypothetical protein